jgi:UDP-N-acetylmuramoyl-tripeptide--D-alanyl-D-alanine ligase
MRISELKDIISAKINHLDFASADFHGVSIDSRQIKSKQLYVALKGPTHDGHHFVKKAAEAGAAAAIVSEWVDCDLPQLKVKDTLVALQTYAAWHRTQFNPRVIAITGSCGKTTTRQLCESILSQQGSVLATEGNLNNHIGVPLMLLRLTQEHQFMVLECGASHVGEIATLASWVKPDVAVITNAGHAHIEGFGSLERVAIGKGEIYQALTTDGVAIINADDQYYKYWQSIAPCQRIISFSTQLMSADVVANDVSTQHPLSFNLSIDNQQCPVTLNLLGAHNINNALAAAAATHAVGISVENIQTGLSQSQSVSGRLCSYRGWQDALIIDDAYNANPSSLKAAIDTLVAMPTCDQRVLVVGDMLELGENAPKWHYEIGTYAKSKGVDHLLSYGILSAQCVKSFGEGASHFADQEALIGQLKTIVKASSVVLIKGSNSMGMSCVANALR